MTSFFIRWLRCAAALCLSVAGMAHGAPPPHGGPFLDATRTMNCTDDASCLALAQAYYRYTGVFDAQNKPTPTRGSFALWKQLHGFNANPQNPAPGEVRAVYYNQGDLKIGRDMHCRVYPVTTPGLPFNFKTLACYVTNFGEGGRDFGVSAPGPSIAFAHAADGDPHKSVATVVMEVSYPEGFGFRESEVWFTVYGNDDKPLATARLDNSNNKSNAQAVPGTCLSCHGGFGRLGRGSRVQLDGAMVLVQNARFLPFDVGQFLYGDGTRTVPNAAEQESFRKLNAMIADLYAPWTPFPIKDLIAGWYGWCGGVAQPGCTQDAAKHPYIPTGTCAADAPSISGGIFRSCGWANGVVPYGAGKPGFDIKEFYAKVIAPNCRGCHVASPERFNVQNYSTWLGGDGKAGLPNAYIRGNRKMPFAEATYNNFYGDARALTLTSQYFDPIAVPKPLTPIQECQASCVSERSSCIAGGASGGSCSSQYASCIRECARLSGP